MCMYFYKKSNSYKTEVFFIQSDCQHSWPNSKHEVNTYWWRHFQAPVVPVVGVNIWEVRAGHVHATWAGGGRRWRLLVWVFQRRHRRLQQTGSGTSAFTSLSPLLTNFVKFLNCLDFCYLKFWSILLKM